MRLADLAEDNNANNSAPASERIATGAGSTPMILPTPPTNSGSVVGSPNSATNGVLMDDDDDFLQEDTSPFYIDDAFEVHTSNFKGKRVKPKQPSASIAKLPATKPKDVAVSTPDHFLDDNGNEYEYLGQFNGDLSFLDEIYKGVVVKPGSHLYRRNTGVQFDGDQAEYEYFIGDDPESSAIFGKIFKGIGKAIKKVGKKVLPFVAPGVSGALAFFKRRKKSNFSGFDGVEHNGEFYEYVGQTNGDLSFLNEIEPGVIVPSGAHIYKVQRTESFDGQAEFDYYMGSHPDISNGLGSFFKKIGKGLGKVIKGVGKGIGKVAKAGYRFGKKAMPFISPVAGLLMKNRDDDDFVGVEHNGDYYEYIGQHDGDLSFIDQIEPGVKIPLGAHLYKVQRTESFDGLAEYDYYIGAHPDLSNGLGSFFKKVGKGIGKVAKAVGKGIGNAAKWTGKTVVKGVKATGKGIGNAAKWTEKNILPLLTGQQQQQEVDQSNGVIMPYNPTAGLEMSAGNFNDEDFGAGLYQQQSMGSELASSNDAAERNLMLPSETPGKNKLLIYAAIALGIIGLMFYLKKNK